MKNKLIITCEHASNNIPTELEYLFASTKAQNDLSSHLGIDIGAKNAALYIEDFFKCPIQLADYSRLLIELNRTLGNKQVFSKYSQTLETDIKNKIINNIYLTYRNKVENLIKKHISTNNRVIHLSIHSFTPVLNNQTRLTDIGLLYDPKRSYEKELCSSVKHIYSKNNNNKYQLRLNYPYKGYTDGFTTYLRKIFNHDQYLGIEIEINQKYAVNNSFPNELLNSLCDALKVAINNL